MTKYRDWQNLDNTVDIDATLEEYKRLGWGAYPDRGRLMFYFLNDIRNSHIVNILEDPELDISQ